MVFVLDKFSSLDIKIVINTKDKVPSSVFEQVSRHKGSWSGGCLSDNYGFLWILFAIQSTGPAFCDFFCYLCSCFTLNNFLL